LSMESVTTMMLITIQTVIAKIIGECLVAV
jgi:hypothetical protein